jgi:hypothetical protein
MTEYGRENTMMFAEIINTCTNEKVAEAAIASISVAFLNDMRRYADAHDMGVGEYAAGLVRRFKWRASECERKTLNVSMDGSQAPVLAGLRYILETMMKEEDSAGSHPRAPCSRLRHVLDAAA